MTKKLISVCDGCDAERIVRPGHSSDWKSVELVLTGLAGYPTCRPDTTEPMKYDFCPACAKRFYDAVLPHLWPRADRAPPADWDNQKGALIV